MARWTDISGSDDVVASDGSTGQTLDPVSQSCRPNLHDLIDALTAVGLGINTNLIWLERDEPDVESARRTARKLIKDFSRMERLIGTVVMDDR